MVKKKAVSRAKTANHGINYKYSRIVSALAPCKTLGRFQNNTAVLSCQAVPAVCDTLSFSVNTTKMDGFKLKLKTHLYMHRYTYAYIYTHTYIYAYVRTRVSLYFTPYVWLIARIYISWALQTGRRDLRWPLGMWAVADCILWAVTICCDIDVIVQPHCYVDLNNPFLVATILYANVEWTRCNKLL